MPRFNGHLFTQEKVPYTSLQKSEKGRKRGARLMKEYGMRGRCVRVYKAAPKGTRKYDGKLPNHLLDAGKPTSNGLTMSRT